MTNSKSTKRALLSSAFAILVCVAMLIGTTFAWFTDTASTAVNKIQAGNLNVTLEMQKADGTWVPAENKTLEWKTADNRAQADILWEPGCTYELQPVRVKNDGNLALKYKIVISGIKGSAKLNNVIEWTINDAALESDHHLAAGAVSDALTIKGHMQESAGNEYMNEKIENIAITVYATQDTVENDSYGNGYDKDATYYPVLNAAGMKDALARGGNIKVDVDIDPSEALVVDKETTVNMNGKTVANTDDVWDKNPNSWSLISARKNANLTITGNGTFKAKKNDCYAVDVQDGAVVTIENGTFIGNIHAVYVEEGTAYIKGGFFSVQQKYPDASKADEFVLNCYDANRANSTAKIVVTGGTYVNFNPANCQAEGANTNFVADGYSVVTEVKANGEKWYTVVKGTGVVPGTQEELNNGITDSTEKDVTVVLPKNSGFTLDNEIANSGSKSRNVTFVGNGSQTVDVAKKAPAAEGAMHLNYQRGSTFTFENVTVENGTDTYDGIVCDELVYKNCIIKGVTTLYGRATFIDCIFENTMDNQYSIWTWGGTDVKFEGCTFNTNGKAILLFGEEKTTDLTVSKCTFNDRRNGAAGKAAVEVGEANYGKHNNFTLVINGAVVNGHAIGKNTNTNLWANKNSMGKDYLSVTVDGVKVL